MAPVVDNQVQLDAAAALVRPTFVVVESFKNSSPLRYKNCSGFILSAMDGKVYVAVSERKVCRGDIISVRFHDNAVEDAKIVGSHLGFHILLVVGQGIFQPVAHVGLATRTDVVFFSQSSKEVELNFDAYSSSMIFPTNEACLLKAKSTKKVVHDEGYFTIGFSANTNVRDVVGAPVYDFHGGFLGVIESSEPEYDDIVYVRRAVKFLPELRATL